MSCLPRDNLVLMLDSLHDLIGFRGLQRWRPPPRDDSTVGVPAVRVRQGRACHGVRRELPRWLAVLRVAPWRMRDHAGVDDVFQ